MNVVWGTVPSGQVGVPYSYTPTIVGTVGPYEFTLPNGTTGFPPGLTLNPTTGEISGIPTTVGSSYYFYILVKAGDAGSGSDGPRIRGLGTGGDDYTGLNLAVGSDFPLVCASATGLPTGLYWETDRIKGTCTTPGVYTVSINGVTGIWVVATTGLIANFYPSHFRLYTGVSATVSLTPSTDTSPYTFYKYSDFWFYSPNYGSPLPDVPVEEDLPPGISFDPSTGIFSGTPTKAGTSFGGSYTDLIQPDYCFWIVAVDSDFHTITQSIAFNITRSSCYGNYYPLSVTSAPSVNICSVGGVFMPNIPSVSQVINTCTII
jgi:hypothetical protein